MDLIVFSSLSVALVYFFFFSAADAFHLMGISNQFNSK